jgi:hypothetical protein
VLEEFLGREEVAPRFHKGWVDLMIDVDRDTFGKDVNEELKRNRSGGLPWLVILDADGKELISSNAPPDGSNIGSPVSVEECRWFLEMLDKTRTHTTDEDHDVLKKELELHAAPRRRR